jgi:hypothetical protein
VRRRVSHYPRPLAPRSLVGFGRVPRATDDRGKGVFPIRHLQPTQAESPASSVDFSALRHPPPNKGVHGRQVGSCRSWRMARCEPHSRLTERKLERPRPSPTVVATSRSEQCVEAFLEFHARDADFLAGYFLGMRKQRLPGADNSSRRSRPFRWEHAYLPSMSILSLTSTWHRCCNSPRPVADIEKAIGHWHLKPPPPGTCTLRGGHWNVCACAQSPANGPPRRKSATRPLISSACPNN